MSSSILAQLLSLGFDLELARESLEVGVCESVESAVEWVTARQAGATIEEARTRTDAGRSGNNGMSSEGGSGGGNGPTLRLGPSRGVGISSPFAPDTNASPLKLAPEQVENAIQEAERKAALAAAANNASTGPSASSASASTAPGPSSLPTTPSDQPKVQSRYKESKDDLRMLADRKRAEDYAKFRRQEKDEKEKILRQIKEDRERTKDMKSPMPFMQFVPKAFRQPESAAELFTKPPPGPTAGANQTTIQLTLPDGRKFRRVFNKTDSTELVWDFAQSYILKSEGEFGLVETVPPRRQLYRADAASKTVEESGLVPTASLAVVKQTSAGGSVLGNTLGASAATAAPATASGPESPVSPEQEPAAPSSPTSPPIPGNPVYSTGPRRPQIQTLGGGQPGNHPFLGGMGGMRPSGGMTLGGGNTTAGQRNRGGHVASRPTAFTGTPGFPTGGQIRTGFSHEHEQSGSSFVFGGQGRTLGGGGGGPPDGGPPDDDDDGNDGANNEQEERRRREEEDARRRAAFLDSLARGGAKAGGAAAGSLPGQGKALTRGELSSLKDAGLRQVAALLTDPKLPAKDLAPLRYLSPQLADAVLATLMAQKKLDIHSLKRITARCALESVSLDSYRLATDSLLAILGTTTIRKLTLRGCSYVTDDGIRSLAPLSKTLEHLDLSNVKLTDKAAPVIASMKNLVYLDLSSTKISTHGVRLIGKMLGGETTGLETLVLAQCAGVTGASIFEDLKPLRNLESLSLASTAIASPLTPPSGPQAHVFPNLRILDVSRTKVSDEDLRKIVCGFAKLESLDLRACAGVGVEGLQNVARFLKNLSNMTLPSKELPLDVVLPTLSANKTPLASLDLEGCSDLSDTGLAAISGFAPTLKQLSLAGLKTISIHALTTMLSSLDLVSLDLDRVACLCPPLLNPENQEEESFANSIRAYGSLESLSLAQTGVTNLSLEIWNGGAVADPNEQAGKSGREQQVQQPPVRLNADREARFKRSLRKLNLSKCVGVTDRGVRCLGGFLNLSFLNLDHTGVTQGCLDSLNDLPNLQRPRLLGIPPRGQAPRQPQAGHANDEDMDEFRDDFRWAGPGSTIAGRRVAAQGPAPPPNMPQWQMDMLPWEGAQADLMDQDAEEQAEEGREDGDDMDESQ